MSEVFHYLYFLASDEETIEAVWQKIGDLHHLSDRQVDPEDAGLSVSRSASGEEVSAILFITGHIATFELGFRQGDPEARTGALDRTRKALEDELYDSIGESTFLISSEGEGKGEGIPLSSEDLPDGRISVVPEKRGEPRCFLVYISTRHKKKQRTEQIKDHEFM